MTPARAERIAAAEREVELSRQRLQDTRENVIKPLMAAAEQNNFAMIIAQSLTQGHRGRSPRALSRIGKVEGGVLAEHLTCGGIVGLGCVFFLEEVPEVEQAGHRA